MRKTHRAKLRPTAEQGRALRATMKQYAGACDAIIAYAVEKEEYSQAKLQQGIYLRVREEFHLGAQTAMLAIKQIADTYRITQDLKGLTVQPCMVYDRRTCRFLDDGTVSLWTLKGRRVMPYEAYEPTSIITPDYWNDISQPIESDHNGKADLIPFLAEEIELFEEKGVLVLNILYSQQTIDYAYERNKQGSAYR